MSLSTMTELEGPVLTVRLAGVADASSESVLSRYLAGVHLAALAAHATEVVVDLGALELPSSACLEIFAAWIANVAAAPELERYRIHFVDETDGLVGAAAA